MNLDFDNIPDRRHTESAKWNYFDEDVLPMWVADMDFLSAEPIRKALHKRVEHGVFGYPMPIQDLKEAVIAWMSTRFGWTISLEDIILVPGVVTGFNLTAHTVTRPGDGVLFQTPAYGPFFQVADNADLCQQDSELVRQADGHYIIDFDAFKHTITGRSGLFILCNPQNPTGRVFTEGELTEIADICLRNDITICSDEIHCDLVYSGQAHIPIASLDPEIASNTITLIAPSKTFNIAGLKSSIAIIQNPGLRSKFEAASKGLVGSVNLLGQVAALAAYKEGAPWLDASLKYLEANRDYLVDYVNKHLPGISTIHPEGTYLAWLDCRSSEIQGKVGKFFLDEARVALNDGTWFGKGGDGFVRMNFGCPRSMLMKALEQMKDALINIGRA